MIRKLRNVPVRVRIGKLRTVTGRVTIRKLRNVPVGVRIRRG